jgi:1,4-alpha-glucan branching enzyme
MKMTNKTISGKAQPTEASAVRKAPTRKGKAAPEAIQTQPAKPEAVVATASIKSAPSKSTGSAKSVAPSISLELVKPDAQQVFVAGSFNGWKPETTPLRRTENGHWIGNVNVTPGRHEYLFVVDGQWMPDPNAKETVQNPFGGQNSVFSVSA